MKFAKLIGMAMIVLIIFAGLGLSGFARAQTNQPVSPAPEFLASWQANSYVPSWYQGKIFPVYGSRIDVNFELIDNGKIADLSKNIVRWYVNDDLMINEQNGLGIKKLSFVNNYFYGGELEVKISLPDYKSGSLIKIIHIPVKTPEVAIEAPYFDRTLNAGKNLILAWPFFFGVSDPNNLSLEWRADDKTTAKATALNSSFYINVPVNTASGKKISLFARFNNLKNNVEFSSKAIIFETP